MKDVIFIMVDKDFNGGDVLTKKLQEGYKITSSISVNGQGWYVVEREKYAEWRGGCNKKVVKIQEFNECL